jgi:hypothetical protein
VSAFVAILSLVLILNCECRILLLQRDRFFDDLFARTWNKSRRALCNLGGNIDSGITLESIGQLHL